MSNFHLRVCAALCSRAPGAARGRACREHFAQVCSHPLLTYPPAGLDKDSLRFWAPAPDDDRIVAECGKMLYLDRLLVKFRRSGHRVLLFSTMTRVLDLLEVYLSWRCVNDAYPGLFPPRSPDSASKARCRRRLLLLVLASPCSGSVCLGALATGALGSGDTPVHADAICRRIDVAHRGAASGHRRVFRPFLLGRVRALRPHPTRCGGAQAS